MSVPTTMPCLHPNDECPSPMRCHFAGGCIERRRDSYLSWGEAIEESRKRGVIPESWKREADHG